MTRAPQVRLSAYERTINALDGIRRTKSKNAIAYDLARVGILETLVAERTAILLSAIELAEKFILDDTCRHDSEKSEIIRSTRLAKEMSR